MKILLERFPYRYVESGTLENGMPDFRIQRPPWQSEVASGCQGGTCQSNAWYTHELFEYDSLAYR